MIKKIFTGQRLAILFDLLIIAVISLSPFNWLHDGQIITGHDSGGALIPLEHFKDRLFVWTNRWGLSADQTNALGAFFIHGPEAFFSWLGFSLQKTEQINYALWLFIPGISMYYFARSVFSKRRYLPLIASVFFMLNHFLLQGWMITERTKFSTYAAMPLILLFIFRFFEGKLSWLSAGLLTGVTLFFLNGGGNLPLFGSILILIPLAIIYFTYLNFSFNLLKRAFLYLITAAFSTIALWSFWLIPYVFFVLQEYNGEVARAGGIDGVIGWATVISENTSFLNLMRLQGIPDWYNNLFHPYSNLFLQNPFLIAISFLIPVLAFGSWFLIKNLKEKTLLLFFMITGFMGMIFAAGLHQPSGFIYELLLRFVPGFIMFRTPFYKFAPLIWFSYSVLIAITIDELLRRLVLFRGISFQFFSKFAKIGAILVVLAIILYHYPILDGRFFDYEQGRSMRVKVPDYILKFEKWADGPENKMVRSLLLPGLRFDNKLETYDWGYFSLATLTTLLTRETFMVNAFYNTKTEDMILDSIYENLLNNENGWDKLASIMGAKNFVVRGDFKWDAKGAITRKPEDYELTLKNSPLIDLTKVFGEWKVYSFKEGFVNPLITTTSNIAYVQSNPSFMRYLTSIPNFDQKKPLYFEDQNENLYKDKDLYLSSSDATYLLPECIVCDLKLPSPVVDPGGPLILPASPFYFIVQQRENDLRSKATTLSRKLDFLLEISLRRLQEAKKMIDFRTNEEFVARPLNAHYNLLRDLDSLLVNKNDFNTKAGNEMLIRIESYLEAEKRYIEDIFTTSPNDVEKEVNITYPRILSVLKRVKSWNWRTTSEDDKKYIIAVEKQGEYKVWLRRDRLEIPSDVDPSTLTLSLVVDGQLYQGKPEDVQESWILIKKLDLKKGIHRISFKLPPVELFKGAVEVIEGESSNFLSVNDGIYTLNAYGGKNCLVFPVKNITSGTSYRISFKHRKTQGDQNLRVFISPKDTRLLALTKTGDVLVGVTTFRDYRMDMQLIESNEIFINVCTELQRSLIYAPLTSIEIKDISVRKLSSPVFIFEKTLTLKENQPEISFVRVNQTKYKVNVKNASNPFFLTFSQRYSKDWKIYFDDSSSKDGLLSIFTSPSGYFSITNLLREPLSEKYHFISNTYANTWYIDKEGDSEIIIEYRGQLRYYVAWLITLISLILFIVVLLRLNKRKLQN